MELNEATALTGRVKTFLQTPEMGTLPVSCTTIKADFGVAGIDKLIKFISKALRTGSGVNVHLENLDLVDYGFKSQSEFYLYCEEENTEDFKELEQSTYYTSYITNNDSLINVSDSMEEKDQAYKPVKTHYCKYPFGNNLRSIEECIYWAFIGGQKGNRIVFNLTAIRPSGLTNSQGMVSSGKASFGFILSKAYEFGKNLDMKSCLAFLSSFNQELRRGGTYKNGAITTSYPIYGKYAKEYITLNASVHPWLKKGLTLTSDFMEFSDLIPDIKYAVNAGVLWLEKAVIPGNSLEQPFLWLSSTSKLLKDRILSNVCREIFLPSRGTCNLVHVNLSHFRDFSNIVKT
ncbi:MAG TPA: hypothetical protein V6C96_00490, partial [Vampirovibrionales bacterium]